MYITVSQLAAKINNLERFAIQELQNDIINVIEFAAIERQTDTDVQYIEKDIIFSVEWENGDIKEFTKEELPIEVKQFMNNAKHIKTRFPDPGKGKNIRETFYYNIW